MSFTLTPLNKLLTTPPSNQWLIKDHIEKDSIGMFFGDPESAKSLLAMDIAFCVATGIDWNGNTTVQGKVVYIAGEGKNGIAKRFKALSEKYGRSINDIHISTDSVSLTNEESANEVKCAIKGLDENPALIIIDTLHRNFGDGDENSAKDMGKFIKNIDEKLKDTGATVLIIHHTGHSDKGRARGSITLNGALDVEYMVKKKDTSVTLKCTKSKDFKKPDPTSFKLETHAIKDPTWVDDNGVQLESVTLKSTSYVQTVGLSGLNLEAFEILENEINDNGFNIPTSINTSLPSVKCIKVESWKRLALKGLSSPTYEARKKAFDRAVKKLEELGKIGMDKDYVWLS